MLVDRKVAELVDNQHGGLQVAVNSRLSLPADWAAARVLMMSTAVVKSTECPFRQAAWPRAIDRWVLPRPTLPIRTTLVWVAMKARRNRFWICGRLIFLGQLHWKSSSDLSTGKRAFLIRRSMLRFSRIVASPSINCSR